jgi:hypothetical protein
LILETLADLGENSNRKQPIDSARFIRESVRAEPVEAQPFDKLRVNGTQFNSCRINSLAGLP